MKLREIAVFTRQLSTMVDSGLSVVRSLGILAAQVENPSLAKVLVAVRLDLEHGSSLSAALPSTRRSSRISIAPYRSWRGWGEPRRGTGTARYHHRESGDTQRTIRSAMTYPAVVLSVMVVIFTAMLVFIVPVFKNLFTRTWRQTPLSDAGA